MKWSDFAWEIIDNGLYVAHLVAIALVGVSAVACPILISALLVEVRGIRTDIQAKQIVVECRHDKIPFPHVLPRIRQPGEEATQ